MVKKKKKRFQGKLDFDHFNMSDLWDPEVIDFDLINSHSSYGGTVLVIF